MLHELVHMEINPHNAKFYKMLDELRVECEKLMREGNYIFSVHTERDCSEDWLCWS